MYGDEIDLITWPKLSKTCLQVNLLKKDYWYCLNTCLIERKLRLMIKSNPYTVLKKHMALIVNTEYQVLWDKGK